MPDQQSNVDSSHSRIELHHLFHIVLSFATHRKLSFKEILDLFNILEVFTASSSGTLIIFKEGKLEHIPSGKRISEVTNTILDNLSKLSKEKCMKISFNIQLHFPFGCQDVRVDFDRMDCGDSFAFLFGQGLFMRRPSGPYLEERIEKLYELGSDLFAKGNFIVGLIGVENWVRRISDEELIRFPPVDWVFWKGDVMRLVPNNIVDQAKRAALEAKPLLDDGTFWKWTIFGEHIMPERKKQMLLLQKHIAIALTNVLEPKKTSN